MNILKKFLLVSFLFATPTLIFSQGVTITGVQGIVNVRLTPQEEWKAAYTGMELPEGASIRTAESSRASIKFPNKSTIWLKENTSLALKERKERSNEMDVESGEIKFRVPHLKWKEKFNITSGKTVASVRGTEGVFRYQLGENPRLSVLFGEVSVSAIAENGAIHFIASIPQGTGFLFPTTQRGLRGIESIASEFAQRNSGKLEKSGTISLLTTAEEKEGQKNWDAGLTEQERSAAGEAKEQARDTIRQFAQVIQQTNQDVRDQSVQIKEEDFATGRTLRDVHGNLVRVDQRLDRTANSIQVINVVKRTEGYQSGGLRAFTYNGSSGNRVDAVITKVVFNANLPDQINEFPGFFDAQGDSLKVDKVQTVMANQTDNSNVFAIGFFGRRDSTSGTDNIDTDLYIGTLKDTVGGTSGKQKLFSLDIDSSRNVAGLTRFVEDTTISGISVQGVNGELYGREARRWQQYDVPSEKLWLATENFVINNSGNVRNVSDFTNTGSNFEALLKENAGEMVVFAKADSSNAPGTADATNFAGGNATSKNIDIVVIPDLGLSIIKSIGTGFDKIKTQ